MKLFLSVLSFVLAVFSIFCFYWLAVLIFGDIEAATAVIKDSDAYSFVGCVTGIVLISVYFTNLSVYFFRGYLSDRKSRISA